MKKIKKLTIVLTILLISLVSFAGIYIQKQNRMENIVKDYELGMNLSGYREVRLTLTDGQELTKEKIAQTKKILEARIEELGAKDYILRTNEGTGEIVLELEENSNTDKIISNIYQVGNFRVVDSENEETILLTKDDLKQASVKYNTTETGTTVYLDLEFTEEGAKTLEDLSTNAYKTIEETEDTTETEATEGTATEGEGESEEVVQPKIKLKIDDSDMTTTSFAEPITTGAIQLSLSSASTDTETIQTAIDNGLTISTILNNGPLPMEYQVSTNQYVYSEITEEMLAIFSVAVVVIVLIGIVVLALKHKMSAIFAGISLIGFIALYLLIIRYANVILTIEGIAGILLVIWINYLLIKAMLKKSDAVEVYKEFFTEMIPVIIAIVVFSFISWTNIASFGMVMFWGLLLTVPYHLAVTHTLIEEEK